jgi:hypothetical protein
MRRLKDVARKAGAVLLVLVALVVLGAIGIAVTLFAGH